MVTGSPIDSFMNMSIRQFKEFVVAIAATLEKRKQGPH